MIYSKTCEYALRALAYLASRKQGSYVVTSEISRKTEVPEPYIAKIFQGLEKTGLLQSRRGPAGGIVLIKPPDKISLYEVVQAVDDTAVFGDCIMGLNECSAARACPLHAVWSGTKYKMLAKLRETTVLQLASQLVKRRYRGSQRAKLSTSLRKAIGTQQGRTAR